MNGKDQVKFKIEAFAVMVSHRLAHVSPTYKPDIGMLVLAIPAKYLFDVAHCDPEDSVGNISAITTLDRCILDIIEGVEWMNTHKEATNER